MAVAVSILGAIIASYREKKSDAERQADVVEYLKARLQSGKGAVSSHFFLMVKNLLDLFASS